MSRLPKHGLSRQHELFARADIPEHVPSVEYFAAVERRREQHEPKPVLWQGMGSWVRQLGSFPESWEQSVGQKDRFKKTARMLDAEKVRLCSHADALEMVEASLADFRNNGLLGPLTRAEIGGLLVEVRNRLTLLRMGRAAPKAKGPRLDPASLPDAALERLIQTHQNMTLVEQLRAERMRRTIAT